MAKKSDEMKTIDARLDKQDLLLREILLCLKGSESMNIEGVIPAQKRIEKKIDTEIQVLTEWKSAIQKYIDVLSSKAFKRFIIGIIIAFAGMFLYLKFGWNAILKYITWVFL